MLLPCSPPSVCTITASLPEPISARNAVTRAWSVADVDVPLIDSEPVCGSATGTLRSPVRNSVLPAIDRPTGVVPPAPFITSAMRPPQPLGAVRLLRRMPCSWRCWSSWEYRLGGAAPFVL